LAVEKELRKDKSIDYIYTRFPDDFVEAYRFYTAKGFVEIDRVGDLRCARKQL